MTAPVNTTFTTGTTITSNWLNGVNDAINDSTQDITGAVPRTLPAKLSDTVSVKDFGAVGDGVTDDTAAIQAAIDYCVANGTSLLVNCLSKITAPLVITGTNGDTGTGGLTIYGDDGKTNCGFFKTTHTAYAGIDSVLYVMMPSGATYGANVYIKNLKIDGDITGDQRTDLCTYGIYVKDDFTQLQIDNCFVSGEIGIGVPNDLWQSSITKTLIHPKNKGIEMLASGTSNFLANVFVNAPLVVGFELRGSYSSANALACDGATGTAYKFYSGDWTVNGLGCESQDVTYSVNIYNCNLTVTNSRIFFPSADTAAIFYVESGSSLKAINTYIRNGTGNTTAAGYLFNYTTASSIEFDGLRFSDAKRFKYQPAPNSSVGVYLKDMVSPFYGNTMQRNNLQCIAGLPSFNADYYAATSTKVGAAIFTGGSDINPNIDTIRFDAGVPVRSIILNTRGSSATTQGWICTATGATISASTFVAWTV